MAICVLEISELSQKVKKEYLSQLIISLQTKSIIVSLEEVCQEKRQIAYS